MAGLEFHLLAWEELRTFLNLNEIHKFANLQTRKFGSQVGFLLFLRNSAAAVTVTAAINAAAAMTNGNSLADFTVSSVGRGD